MSTPRVNRKNRTPSQEMLPPDGHRYRCRWLEDSITIHSDGNASCGLDDPHANRSFGNIRQHTVVEIFHNPEIERMRERLASGARCADCSLYELDIGPTTLPVRPDLPTTLIIEATVNCNLRCPNAACIPNNAANLRTRDRNNLDVDTFSELIEEAGPGLERVYFFNYGDPFMNKHAEDMLEHLRHERPSVEIITSTNGIPLAKERRAERVVAAELDHITFTISGVRQESYERYHQNGNVELALRGLENVCAAKHKRGFTRPRIVWRYLLFRWNDSEAELSEALALAQQFGVDQFSLYLTHIPAGAASYRLSPGSPSYRMFEPYIDAAHGYNCEGPAANGLFAIEEQAHLGRAHWSGPQCRLSVAGGRAWINVALSTLDCACPSGQQIVTVQTNWESFDVALEPNVWREIWIYVPRSQRSTNPLEVLVATEQYFFPAEQGSADLRCLGFLVRPVGDPVPHRSWIGRWSDQLQRARRSSCDIVDVSGSVKSLASVIGGGRFVGFSEK